MRKMIILVAMIIVVFLASGCANDMQISTCKDYKNGICTVKKIETIKECKKPLIIDNKTYCR